MRRKTFAVATALLLALALPASGLAQSRDDADEEPKILGRCTVGQLREEPFDEWFRAGYDDYRPNPGVAAQLRDANRQGIELTVFFGTWCGDSRREVPRLVKLLDELGFAGDSVNLIAVDREDTMLKRSPGGEEKGREIYRVPTMVVSRQGTEIARIVESPVLSLERDLLAILTGQDYRPQYDTYPVLRRWLDEGLLADENISPRGLAAQVRHRVAGEGELAAAGQVLLARGQAREAVTLFRVNCDLYPRSARAFERLAAGLVELGETEDARESAERALRLNDDPERVHAVMELLDRIRE